MGGQGSVDGLGNRTSDGVLGTDLDGGGECEHPRGILARQHVDGGEGHAALGDGAGLVEHDRGHLLGALE